MSGLPRTSFTVAREAGEHAWVDVAIDGFTEPFWTEHAKLDAKRHNARMELAHAAESRRRREEGLDELPPVEPVRIPDDAPAERPKTFHVVVGGLPSDPKRRLALIREHVERFVVSQVEKRDLAEQRAGRRGRRTALTDTTHEIGG